MSQFDPEAFLDATLDAPLTKRPPVMPGSYTATIGEVKSRPWASRDGTKSGMAYDVPLEVQLDAAEAERVGQPSVIITDSVMLDLTVDGAIDVAPGKNRKLRAYREATGLNNPGDKFSARMLQGRSVKVIVKHDAAKDGSDDIYERIGAVAKA